MTFAELKALYLEGRTYINVVSYDETASGGGSGACNVNTAAQSESAFLAALNTTGISNTFTTTSAQTYTVSTGNSTLTIGTTVFGFNSLTANAAVRGAAGVEFITIDTPARVGRSYVPRMYPDALSNNFEIVGYRGISDVIYSSQVVLIDDTVYPADTPASTLGDALQVVCSRAFFFDEGGDVDFTALTAQSVTVSELGTVDETSIVAADADGKLGRYSDILLFSSFVGKALGFNVPIFFSRDDGTKVSYISKTPYSVGNGILVNGRSRIDLGVEAQNLFVKMTIGGKNFSVNVNNSNILAGSAFAIFPTPSGEGKLRVSVNGTSMLNTSTEGSVIVASASNGAYFDSQIYKISDNSPQFDTLSSDTNPAAFVTLNAANIARKTTISEALDTFPSYHTDAAAITAGLAVGDWYYRPNHGLKKVDVL